MEGPSHSERQQSAPDLGDGRGFSREALDALREVASIGAGHAATALSEMSGQRTMISVPMVAVLARTALPERVSVLSERIASVVIQLNGDLAGSTLFLLPYNVALRLTGFMMGRRVSGWGELEESALKEAGNIISAAYLNAIAEFLHIRLLNAPPSLVMDSPDRILGDAEVALAQGGESVICVESEFRLANDTLPLHGLFLMLPDAQSLRRMLAAVNVA